ncbi:hypothetical protein MIB92_15985 [Aestuariirhabdus sp. Z084]|uniref:protein YgfX n=1 Tax=Aestuariirhabdus haliotis TaxID=2918751 RepID=UPI00201B3CAB|nr:protein YgfX [Aestuariirhabdus haliotis]MCL6417160.1 hypothetical protein [Aestuariirhabdus haliotis]MCL6421108.1 hypothetical protein [Aestuariirhabdus haliotis]
MDSVVPGKNRFTELRVEASSVMLAWYFGFFTPILLLWLIAPLLLIVKALGLLLLVFHALWWLSRHYLLCGPVAIRALGHDGEQWWVEAGDRVEAAVLDKDVWVSPLLILMRLRGEESGRLYRLVLFCDGADAESLRRLRLRLRWLPVSLKPVSE